MIALLAGWAPKADAAEQKLVRITTHKQDDRTEFVVENLQHADVTITIDLQTTNLVVSQPQPFSATLSPRSKTAVFSVTPENSEIDSGWSYTYSATWGSLHVTHDDDHVYDLPFAAGQMFPVSQGFHGAYTHTGGDSFSIDFKMPKGTPVHAAREGLVVGIKDDSSLGGSEKKFEWDANYILILHSDGTLGHYVHLEKGGSRVKLGQKVSTGDWIGLSGNTGHSTGPHLHFAVFKAESGKKRKTFRIKFKNTPRLAEILAEGRS